MPTFKVEDDSGNTLVLEGDSPPTEQELEEVFSSHTKAPVERGLTVPEGFSTGSFGFEGQGQPIQLSPPRQAAEQAPSPQELALMAERDVQPNSAGMAMSYAGNVSRSVPADVAAGLSLFKRPPNQPITMLPSPTAIAGAVRQNLPTAAEASGNIPAAIFNQPMPVDATIQEAAAESNLRGEGSAVPTLAHVSQGLAATAPLIAGIGAAPRALQFLISAGFSADMIRKAPELFNRYAEEINKPAAEQDPNLIAELQSGIIQTFGFAPLAGAHAVGGGVEAAGGIADRLNLAREKALEPSTRGEPNAIPVRSTAPPVVGEASGNRSQVGTRVPESGQVAGAQEIVQPLPAEESGGGSKETIGLTAEEKAHFQDQIDEATGQTPAAKAPEVIAEEKQLPPIRPDPPIPESEYPPFPKAGNKLVTIQRRDGTTYRAGLDTINSWQKEALPPGSPTEAIHRITIDSEGKPEWSTGMLDPGEKIVPDVAKSTSAPKAETTSVPVNEIGKLKSSGNGGRQAIILPDGTAIVGETAHPVLWNLAIEQGLATEAELLNGIAGAVRPDGKAWGVNGKDLPNVTRVRIVKPQEASAGATALPVRESAMTGRNERKVPPTEQSEKGALETGTSPNAPKETTPTAPGPVGEQLKPGAGAVETVPAEAGVGVAPGGAAVPAEFQPPKPFETSNKNRIVDEERKARGLPPMMEVERQSNQSAWDEAMRKIDENPQVQDELISELTTQPRALTTTENAMLLHRRVDLRNEYEKALHRWKDAFEGDDMVRAAEESQRVKEWSNKLSDLEDVTKATGAESGRSLQARKMMAAEDFSLAAMEMRAMEAKGRQLTPQEHIELIKAQEKIASLQTRLFDLESKRETVEVEKETTETLKDVAKDAPKESKSKEFDVDREDTLLSGIKAKVDKGQHAEITPLVQQLARLFWRQGIHERGPMIDALHEALKAIIPDFTRDQTQRAFSGYGNFKPLKKGEIEAGLRDLRGQTQQVLKIEAIEARKPLEKSGVERRVPSDTERRLIKQVNELKRKYGVVVTDPATQLKSALQSRKTYYEHRIADLQHEIATRERIVKTKSASPRDAELDAMIAEVERLKAEHEQIFTKPEMTDAQRLKLAIAAAERNQAHWEVRLNNAEKGVFSKRDPGRKVSSAELEVIQAETAAIREHVKELKDLANPKKSKEEIALQSLKTRMATQTAALKDRLAKGDFAKRERKSVALDPEATKLKAELSLVKDQFNAGVEKDRWDRSTVFSKNMTRLGGVYDLVKTIMSTGEFSFVLRQGKAHFLEALTSPKRMMSFTRAFKDSIRAMQSPLQQRIVEQTIFSDPMYPQMLRDKLYVPEHGSKLSKQEEFAMGRYSDAIPFVQAFNRAGETFLKKLRFDGYKAMAKSMTESGVLTPEEGRIVAAFQNEMSGRGGLGAAEPAAVALNRALFSPRYLMSRLQIASGHQLWAGKWDGTGRARKAVASSYARMLIGAGLYYTGLMMFFNRDDKKAELERDFRSSDAGKIRMGDTRLDPMAGIAQVMTMTQRTITGEAMDSKGRVFPIVGNVPYGKDDWTGYAARFAQSKLHPTIGGAIDLRMGKNMVGDPVTLTSKLAESGPMTYYDIYEALRAQDLTDGMALSLLALLGEGLQTYKK